MSVEALGLHCAQMGLRRLLGLVASLLLAFPVSRGFRAAARSRALGQYGTRVRLRKVHACDPRAVAVLVATSLVLCSPVTLSAVADSDSGVISPVAKVVLPLRQGTATASWDLYRRMEVVESTMFTKDDAKEMRAEIKADAKEMRAEIKADAKEMRAEIKADAKEMQMTNYLLFAATLFTSWQFRSESFARMDKQRADDNKRMDEQRAEDRARMDMMEARAATNDVLTLSVAFAALLVVAVTPFASQLIAALAAK